VGRNCRKSKFSAWSERVIDSWMLRVVWMKRCTHKCIEGSVREWLWLMDEVDKVCDRATGLNVPLDIQLVSSELSATRLTKWIWKLIPKTRWGTLNRAISDFTEETVDNQWSIMVNNATGWTEIRLKSRPKAG